jgi:hypothetical protein
MDTIDFIELGLGIITRLIFIPFSNLNRIVGSSFKLGIDLGKRPCATCCSSSPIKAFLGDPPLSAKTKPHPEFKVALSPRYCAASHVDSSPGGASPSFTTAVAEETEVRAPPEPPIVVARARGKEHTVTCLVSVTPTACGTPK